MPMSRKNWGGAPSVKEREAQLSLKVRQNVERERQRVENDAAEDAKIARLREARLAQDAAKTKE